jgi:methylmalonyl-CoA/ethylmalonyl-CoA epimerase
VRIRGLRQIAQHVEDLDRAVAFYGDTLGLPLMAKIDPPGLAFFDIDGTRLLLERGDVSSFLYLDVVDIQSAHRDLVAKGVHFVDDPHVVHHDADGTFGPSGEDEWLAAFLDSEGNTVCLMSRQAHR